MKIKVYSLTTYDDEDIAPYTILFPTLFDLYHYVSKLYEKGLKQWHEDESFRSEPDTLDNFLLKFIKTEDELTIFCDDENKIVITFDTHQL